MILVVGGSKGLGLEIAKIFSETKKVKVIGRTFETFPAISSVEKINLDLLNDLEYEDLDKKFTNDSFEAVFFTLGLINKEDNIFINSKKYKIKLKDQSIENKDNTVGINNFSILNSKFLTEYEFKEKNISFKSDNSQVSNTKVNYNGKLNLNPFNLTLDASVQKINLKKLFKNSAIFLELIKSGKLFHENLNIIVSLNSSNISNSKVLDSLKINFNAINGEIDFNKSFILSNKIGVLKTNNSRLIIDKNILLFDGNFNLDIKDSNSFFSFFQTPKKFRKQIKNISFNLNYNFFENKLTLSDFKIDKIQPEGGVLDILNDFNLDANHQISNLIIFKNLVNNLFSVYEG